MLYISYGTLRAEKLKIEAFLLSSLKRGNIARKFNASVDFKILRPSISLVFASHCFIMTCSGILRNISCCASLAQHHPITKTKPRHYCTMIDCYLFLSSASLKPNDKKYS